MSGLQLFSFRINEETIDDIYLKVFKLPKSVERCIKELSDIKNRSANYRTIFKVATSIFDKIIYSNNTAYEIQRNDNIWFYAIDEFDLELFKLKVTNWLQAEYKNVKGYDLDETFDEEWVFDEDISLNELIKSSGVKFNVIPQYYIYKLSKEKFYFNSLEKELKFNRVIGDDKATMITMPIKLEKKRYTPFSYYITCELKEPIEAIGLVLNFKIHIRVWDDKSIVNENRLGFKYRDGASVYIYKENDYYLFKDILFNKVEIKSYNNQNLNYKNKADEMFVTLMDVNMAEIINSPSEFMDDKNELIGLIINCNKDKLNTQSGAGLPERNEMLRLIAEKLPKLKLREELENLNSRASVTKMRKVTGPIGVEEDEVDNTIPKLNKNPYIPNTLYKNMEIYIATNNDELYKKSKVIIIEALKLESISNESYKSENNCEFKIIHINNDFTRVLESEEEKNQRIKEIESIIEKGDKNTLKLAFIEIENYHKQNGFEDKDPKNLIRVALKNNHVITQFINYDNHKDLDSESTKNSIIYNSLKDLFSAAGFTESMLYDIKNLNHDDILVGISKISTGYNDKILCMSKIINRKILLNIYGINKWMPIEDYIFSLNSGLIKKSMIEIRNNKKEVMDGINGWICDELSDIAEDSNRVLCFIDVDVRSQLWESAQNSSFKKIIDLRVPNIENIVFIRVNSDGSGEVPEYFINDERKGDINKNSGVFKGVDSTYYLVGQRICTDYIPKGVTKCSRPNAPLKRPSLHEVNIQGNLRDEDKDVIAQVTQELRVMNISYDRHASLPLPLYCTRRLTEYIRAEKELYKYLKVL